VDSWRQEAEASCHDGDVENEHQGEVALRLGACSSNSFQTTTPQSAATIGSALDHGIEIANPTRLPAMRLKAVPRPK
jgi:hypothetical protein